MEDLKIAGAGSHHCFTLEEKAPDFTAPACYRGKEIEVCLKNYCGKWLLLFFYSSDFTFV